MPQVVRPTKPELDDHHYVYLSAFYDLSSCRSVGSEVVGDIPFTAILVWLEFWRVCREEAEIFLEVIPRLDKIYLDHIYLKRQESLEKAQRGSKSGGPKRIKSQASRARRSR